MPPARKPQEAAVTPLSDLQVQNHMVYKILAQFSTPKGITVRVTKPKGLWVKVPNLPDVVEGVIDQWVSKASITLRITWTEADGTTKWDTEDLHILLLDHVGFELVKGPKGEALLLRGAAARVHENMQPKETYEVNYTDGIIEKVQLWTIELHPEAIVDDARTAPRSKPELARRKEDVDTPFKAWVNAAQSMKQIDLMVTWFNQRLDGKTHGSRKTSRGEIVRFMCSIMAHGHHRGAPGHGGPQDVEGGQGGQGLLRAAQDGPVRHRPQPLRRSSCSRSSRATRCTL
jgi:hypothetical protein